MPEYVNLYESELYGSDGFFGIKIQVAAKDLPDLKQKEIWSATNKSQELITAAVRGAIKVSNPKTAVATKNNRKVVDQIFSANIFVEEIANGYCSDWCCAHLPWFIVTTSVGRFTIGWRKSVISIDWADTVGTKEAEEIFFDQNVTKGKKSIHAWGLEDAHRYIKAIMLSVDS